MINWIYLLLTIFSLSNSNNNEEEPNTMTAFNTTVRESIEEAIRKKLEDPNITAEDIEHIAKAYSELHKDDNIKELINKNFFNAGFGSLPNTNSQLTNVVKIEDILQPVLEIMVLMAAGL